MSLKLGRECRNYSYSHYFDDVAPGALHPTRGERCENLEGLTFADSTIDLMISQDVMEHIFEPAAAFREIARVLKPGGAHVFTAPLVNKAKPSQRRAQRLNDGSIRHFFEPEYHGNPVDPEGSLVTMNWGYDIASFILTETGMPSVVIQIDDISSGIRAEYIEVVVSFKH
ncbi:methyltransferase domain-containing protein [Maricaulis parjimensis]|uniref:methyltransferase domain-containing protein n=1 Tax=Maricaulis parjimensis TaxID=144023 RepID=UPI00193A442A